MSGIADDLMALMGGVLKVAEGAAEVEQAAARGLTRAASAVDHLTHPETVDRLVKRSVGALLQGVLEEAATASSRPAPVPPQRARVRQRTARKR